MTMSFMNHKSLILFLSQIKVADIDWIKIASEDEISIMVFPFLQFIINSLFGYALLSVIFGMIFSSLI